MAIDDFKIKFEELHTIRTKYNDKSYFKPQPTYPEIIDDEEFFPNLNESMSDEEIIDVWTEKLKNEINNHPHHPNSAIYENTKYQSQIVELYDGEPTRFLNEKDSKKWLSMDNLISSVPLKKNYWFNGGGVGNEAGRLGRFRDWGDKFSSEDIIRGMIKNKVEKRDIDGNKHNVAKLGEYSRIFDLVNGVYAIKAQSSKPLQQISIYIMQFINILNSSDDLKYLRVMNPLTGEPVSENTEEIQYEYKNPNSIYHKDLVFRVFEEVETDVTSDVNIDIDFDLLIKYFMAQEIILQGSLRSPMSVMGPIQGYFREEPYKSALAEINMGPGELATYLKQRNPIDIFEEVNNSDIDDLKEFVNIQKPRIYVEKIVQTELIYVNKTISIDEILDKIMDKETKTNLKQYQPKKSKKDRGGLLVEKKMENILVEEENYLIWITNNPLDVIMSNTSREWGIRSERRWDGVTKKGYVSCINYNGMYSSGPYFDFYNGNGVAYVARVGEEVIDDYMDKMSSGDFDDLTPKELFESNLVEKIGRFSLRWGEKFERENPNEKATKNIGWGIGIETTAYPKEQTWASAIITALAIMFKKIKDNNGNSIWNSDSEGNGREERIRNAVNRITAPYKNGWSYLDYNGNGYTGKIASGNYDCVGLNGVSELIPDYNKGLRFGEKSSSSAAYMEISDDTGADDILEYVEFSLKNYQDITRPQGLIDDIGLWGQRFPEIYRTVAQNPQIWISSLSLAKVIRGLKRNCIGENESIRKDFLELALDSTTKNISWLLQPARETTSLAKNFDEFDTTKQWNWGPECLLKLIFNHPSVLEVFIGHSPDISIQEHLYNQQFILKDRRGLENIANASDIFLLNLENTINEVKIVSIDSDIISDMIRKLKLSVKGNLKNKLPNTIFPEISLNWNFWSNRNTQTTLMAGDGIKNIQNQKDLLTYHQLLVINTLAYNPMLTEKNYIELCGMMAFINEYINGEGISKRKQKAFKKMYNRVYQSLTYNLLYDKSDISSICYQDASIFGSFIHPELPQIGEIFQRCRLNEGFNNIGLESNGDLFEDFSKGSNYDGDIQLSNPLARMTLSSNSILQIRKLQNVTCISAWNKIPQQISEFKFTMLYYLYHFMNSSSSYNHLLKIYIQFLDNTLKGNDNNLEFYGCLFDTLVGADGKLSPCNPYINNSQVVEISKKLKGDNISILQQNIIIPNYKISDLADKNLRREFNGVGLTQFLVMLLNPKYSLSYSMENIILLLRLPRQFAMVEEQIFRLSFGDLFSSKQNRLRGQISRAKYTFTVPSQFNEIIYYDDDTLDFEQLRRIDEIYNIEQETLLCLKRLAVYLTALSSNPYIPESMQSKLILTAQTNTTYSLPSTIIKKDFINNKQINSYKENLHYPDIFEIYGADYDAFEINFATTDLKTTIIENLVKNPIISKNTIKKLINDVDKSLIQDLILNAKFDFNDLDFENTSTSKLLFDNAPNIILNNPAISDELRLQLFNIYMNYLFKNINKKQKDSLNIFKNFILSAGNLRSVKNLTGLKQSLQELNFDNISMWRGGFGKFPINKSIPANIQRIGDSINEQIVSVQKPQIIIDVNFKPPYESVFKKGDDYFLDDVKKELLQEINLQIETTNLMINEELARLNVEEDYDFDNIEDFMENNEGEDAVLPLLNLLNQRRELKSERSKITEQNKTTTDTAPLSLNIRYVEKAELTDKGLKLSGSYWDSGRARITNKWSEVYPNGWDSVYGWNQDDYGLRDDGSKKLWKNQITLVFYDSNPEIGWDLITDEGEDLPLWRYNNDFCNAVAVKKVIRAMIKNMKNPEYSLMEFLINYSSILKTSGNFMYNTINNRIEGAKISLNTNDSYDDNWSPETYLLNSVFRQIDIRGGQTWWDYLLLPNSDEEEDSVQSIYTQDSLLFLLFYSSLGSGDIKELNRPPHVLTKLLTSLRSEQAYEETLEIYNMIEIRESDGKKYLNLGLPIGNFTMDNAGKPILLSLCGEWNYNMTYEQYLRQTGRILVKDNLGKKMVGVENDIRLYDMVYSATSNNYDSELNQFCKRVLIERNYDLIEYMRQEEGLNPEAIIQDAEEFEMSAEEKINIDKDKMEKYILKILGSEIFA